MLGSTCSKVMRVAPLPQARAARTNSRAQMLFAAPRVMRANTGMLKMPIATIDVTSPGPWIAVSMIAVSSAGNANVKSARRITASSTQPRRAAANRPSATPNTMPMPTAITPTAIDARAPTSSSETMSRPRLSVPSQCAALGGSSLFGMSISLAG